MNENEILDYTTRTVALHREALISGRLPEHLSRRIRRISRWTGRTGTNIWIDLIARAEALDAA